MKPKKIPFVQILSLIVAFYGWHLISNTFDYPYSILVDTFDLLGTLIQFIVMYLIYLISYKLLHTLYS